MNPAVPYDAISIYEIYKMEWNRANKIIPTGHYSTVRGATDIEID
jgi:hypothetical protein